MNIKNIILNTHKNGIHQKLKSADLLDSVSCLTSFLNVHYGKIFWTQRFWHIKNDIYELQYCIICQNLEKWCQSDAKYGCSNKKCQLQKAKLTNLDKYGVDNPAKSSKTIKKAKQTNLKKYGMDNYSKTDEFKEKTKQTNLKKYGTDNYSKTGIFKEKTKQTNLKKYGVDSYSKTDEFKKNFEKTNSEKFINKLPIGYKSISYGNILKLKHKKCGSIFNINKQTFYDRLYQQNIEICTHCNPLYGNGISQGESRLQEHISCVYGGETQTSVHDIISPYELDIYIPELKLAFEFNGLYFHSELYKDKSYHKMKSDLCLEQGIQLIHVWEHDWLNKQEIVKSVIQGYLGKHKQIYARRCEIIKLKAKECRKFIDTNHLQGFVGATVYYGLMYDSELVSVMSFQKYKDHWEISRLCTKLNLSIIGGTERLWKHFLRNNEIGKVITYSNRDYFTGKIYERLGFKLEKITKPTYWYVNSHFGVLSRQSCQKHKLIKQGYDPKETEYEIMLKRNYYRCRNSGNYKFIYKQNC